MWYIVRLDSSRVATLDKVRSATLVSSDDPTRVKSNYIPVKLRFFTANRTLPLSDPARDTGTKPQWSGGSHIARTMDTFHASKQSSHGSLAADNTHGEWLGVI